MNIHVQKRGRGRHAMLKRRTRIKRRLRHWLKRVRQSRSILLIAAILLLAAALASRQLPRQSAPPPVLTDRMCQIIWESVSFFERLDNQEMRASQFQNYSRACR